MFILNRALAMLVLLSCATFATSARAGTALYQTSFFIHAFGNDDLGYFAQMPIGRAAAGSGTIPVTTAGSAPAPVALPQSAFGVTTAAYWPIYPPTTFYWTYAAFANEAGGFFAGGGPAAGKGTVSHKGNGNRVGSWFIPKARTRSGERWGYSASRVRLRSSRSRPVALPCLFLESSLAVRAGTSSERSGAARWIL